MALTVYRSDDASAPALTGELGSYVNFLKAILVDGYGAKAGAGWTIELDEIATNGVAIFRNSTATGTGRYLRVQNNGYTDHTAGINTASTTKNISYVRGCESFSDNVNTMGNFPNIGLLGDANPDTAIYPGVNANQVYTSGDTTAHAWIVTADERTVNILTFHSSVAADLGTYSATDKHINWVVYGDLAPLNSSTNPYAFCIWGNSFNTSKGSTYYRGAYGGTYAGTKYLNRGYKANPGGIEMLYSGVMDNYYGTSYCGGNISSATTNTPYPDPVIGGMSYGKLYAMEYASATESGHPNVVNYETISSSLRGVLCTTQTHTTAEQPNGLGVAWDTMTINGNQYTLLWANYSSSKHALLLQTSGNMV